ncbi:unnamed protein product [Adineta steineri]|uniref:Uncharacterized protein n=1 Tax=Adineta steineri TaxID=433720 RepID=A0A815TW81_9BILA|nr:unnamed protein product [Adineta steineri]CAF1460790.1 unnamed protein product [Adineta steineri]CAF1511462.1 unnamed protein product [Adineta steineri]CAF1633169.1 unnamed protein product [Adineta steineri]
MLRKYYFDPRRYHNFLDDVFMNEDETPGHPTLAQMRSAMQASEKYYELWKVRGDFDLAAFYEHFVRGNFDNLCIHVTQLFEDGEYTLTRKQY